MITIRLDGYVMVQSQFDNDYILRLSVLYTTVHSPRSSFLLYLHLPLAPLHPVLHTLQSLSFTH